MFNPIAFLNPGAEIPAARRAIPAALALEAAFQRDGRYPQPVPECVREAERE